MAWSAPMTAVAGATFTASQFNQYVRDNLNATAPALATTASSHFVATGANAIAQRTSATAFVATGETTTSTAYADLTTVGPSVTATTGTMAWVFVSAFANNDTPSASSSFSHAVSGATVAAASDNHRGVYVREGGTSGTTGGRFTAALLRTGLTAGSNTFTVKYKASAGTATFSDRSISILPL